ncbi:MAG: hypothetical protein Q7K39_03370 [Candidatus Magasanikbacteria bacterium]|nr:hypothetical protein [Candidatus Magasanikbacteria bacterium]
MSEKKGPRGKIPVEDNPRKKVINYSVHEGGTIEVSQIDFSNPAEILKLKPKNSVLPDQTWILLVGFKGIVGAWVKDFRAYATAQERTSSKLPGGVVDLGEVGQQFFDQAGRDYKVYVRLVRDSVVKDSSFFDDVTKLGLFGQWFVGSGVSPSRMKEILIEHVNS